jgi:hypothetical protein
MGEDPLFHPIRAFESETDRYAISRPHRQMWDKEALAALDKEMSAYVDDWRPQVVEACKKIIAALEGPAPDD